MIKTVTLSGEETKVEDLGGFNTIVHNLGSSAVYASKYPNIEAGADDVAEVPAGAAKLISTTDGTVFLLGTGRVELTGQDHSSVNFKLPPLFGDSGGTSEVTRTYVDEQDALNLNTANAYTDKQIELVNNSITELQNAKADKSEQSNPNLLDNWYFAGPINQRGRTKYTETGYTIDRWHMFNGIITLNSRSAVLSKKNAELSVFIQKVEAGIERLAGRTVTFSVLTADGKLTYGTDTIPIGNKDYDGNNFRISDKCYMDIVLDSQSSTVDFRVIIEEGSNNTISLVAAKLELGDRQTLARQDENGKWILNDTPPNKGQELAKCQRYQVFGQMESLNLARDLSFLPLPITPISTPTIIGKPLAHSVSDNLPLKDVTIKVHTICEDGVIFKYEPYSVPAYVYFPNNTGIDMNL
ncbi:MAG: hypothetical protein J1F03_03825 [Oscillospiraceae bacterium]|nr:hypothetical protein [Oscillospiraceae bacterium]